MSEMNNNEIIEDDMSIMDEDYDDEEDIVEDDVVEDIEEDVKEDEVEEEKPLTILGQDETFEENQVEENEEEKAIEKQMLSVLEGLLFLTGDDGLTIEQVADTLDVKEDRAAQLVDTLQQYYLEDDRGIEIARFGSKYKFLSKAVVHPYAEKLFQITKNNSLSQAALETLAIIAYRQPITRVEIEEIRGVGADMMLRKLLARNLIKEEGRSDAPGKPILYSVTEDFMDAFQLFSLEELPELPTFQDEEENKDLFTQ